MFLNLVRPFAYLTIKHKSRLPQIVNWIVPSAIAILAVGTARAGGLDIDVFGTNGAVSRVLSFVQSLPGFYIAALAAIATFGGVDMDRIMPGDAPTMSIIYHGQSTEVKATRRRFLSAMFSYLTACSLAITLGSIGVLAIAEPLARLVPTQFHWAFKDVFGFLYLLFLGQMTCVTMWGLFYLGERIHTPD
ncbi:hypothetical protein J7E62_29690 [Variovorax paradoxus]|nr:hypothetical protein [Variovorax paradoxus]